MAIATKERIEDQQFGAEPPPAPLPAEPRSAAKQENWYQRNKELSWSLIAGILLATGWIGERWFGLPHSVALAIFAASYLFGGWDLVRHLIEHIRDRSFSFGIDTLMLVAALGAAALGEYAEGAFLLFLFSLAHALEHYALGRARHAIEALAELAPSTARVSRNGTEQMVPIEQVQPGDVVLILPGEHIPVDGLVIDGESAVNQASITGESIPVDKRASDSVFAGTINGEGMLTVRNEHAVGDRTLDRVIKLVTEAESQQAPTQEFTDRFARIFVPVVLITDILVITVPALMGWWSWHTSFYRGMALLVAASPCALALGTPATVLAGIAQAARHGVLIKGGAFLENLGRLKAMAFDKTGTLTTGKPAVEGIRPAAGVSESELIQVAASVEQRSQHPLAMAVVERAKSDGLALTPVREINSLTARGIEAMLNGELVQIGSLRVWEKEAATVPQEIRQAADELASSGQSVVVVRSGSKWLGVLGVADQPREGVRAVLATLRRLGLTPLVMLTGDANAVGKQIGQQVGVDEVLGDLLPEAKVTAVQDLLKQYGQVAMVGDGVNDAPALATSTVGIAMGGAGTAVALETADIALMSDDLERLPYAVALSRQASRIIRQNLAVSLGVIALLVIATITGIFGIGSAVLVHEGSTLVVLANALRLLRFSGPAIKLS